LSNAFEGQQELERTLMLNQIARIVADAKAKRLILSAGNHAARLFAEFPHANLAVARIVEEILLAAKLAGVTVKVS
jgi:hypothetical protein